MSKAPVQSNTQLGISEQTAREFKRIAEHEEQAGTESWNDGDYDAAASHFERGASTLKKYAAHIQVAAQQQAIKRKAAKLLDLCRQLRELMVTGKPDEVRAKKLRTESQSELAVINADLLAATPKEASESARQKAAPSAPAAPPVEVQPPSGAQDQSPSKPHLRLVASTEKPPVKSDSDPLGLTLAPDAQAIPLESSTSQPSPPLKRVDDPPGFLKPNRLAELSAALLKCEFEAVARCFDGISEDMAGSHVAAAGEIEQMLTSVFAREIAGVLRKAPGELGGGALELARRAYSEGNFKGAAEHFKQAALDLLDAVPGGISDEEVAANELRASRLLTFSSRLRKTQGEAKPAPQA